MNNYFVHYLYNTTHPNFACNYVYLTVQATSQEEAIQKARKQAPKGATMFRAYLR